MLLLTYMRIRCARAVSKAASVVWDIFGQTSSVLNKDRAQC